MLYNDTAGNYLNVFANIRLESKKKNKQGKYYIVDITTMISHCLSIKHTSYLSIVIASVLHCSLKTF